MVNKMNKKAVIFWIGICIFLSACVYLTMPRLKTVLLSKALRPTLSFPYIWWGGFQTMALYAPLWANHTKQSQYKLGISL